MKTLLKALCILSFLLIQKTSLSNILPTFNMTVKNIQTSPNIWGGDSLIFFDIYCQHTNATISDPFEYGASQFTLSFNKAIRQNGVLNAVRVGSDLPTILQNPTMTVDTALGYIKASGNIPSSQENYFISSVFPGTKILRVKFRTSLHTWPLVPLNLRFKLGMSPNTFVAYLAPYPAGTDTEQFPNQQAIALLDTLSNIYVVDNAPFCTHCTPPPPKNIKVTALFEGTYNEISNLTSRADTVTVYVRRAVSPFDIIQGRSLKLDSVTSSVGFSISNFSPGIYYLVLYHSQCVETWSKMGGDTIDHNYIPVNNTYYYNFTTSSSRAYGNNLKLKGNKYCLFSGDVDQNGFIDLSDLSLIFNDVQNFQANNNNHTDLNGDNIVDLNDLLIVFNNAGAYVTRITPP